MPHPIFTLFLGVMLAAAFAAVEDRTRRERLYVAIRLFLGCLASVVGGEWMMRLIHD
jgi:hypothetical protein